MAERNDVRELTPAPEDAFELMQAITGFWLAPTLAVAVRLGLPDILADTPCTATEIAAAAGCDPGAVTRLLNALASVGVFTRRADGRYGPSAKSLLLREDHPGRLGHLFDIGMSGENLAAWNALEEAVRNGGCAFELQHGVDWVAYLDERPARRDRFAAAMTSTTRSSEEALLDGYDFGRFTHVVDIGGSHASLTGGLLQRHPEARGTVFDLPDIVNSGRISWANAAFASRLEAVGGSFFEAVPEGDLHILKQVLHDWDDEDALAILRTVRKAARPDGRLAIIETVLPDTAEPHPAWGMDMVMMVATGGRERSAREYRALLRAAGFEPVSLTATRSQYSVIEARPI
jgi:hypothetical protein